VRAGLLGEPVFVSSPRLVPVVAAPDRLAASDIARQAHGIAPGLLTGLQYWTLSDSGDQVDAVEVQGLG